MKKKLLLSALIAFLAFNGFLACMDDTADQIPTLEEINSVDLKDMRYDGDEDDSLIDPFGGH
ncbi:MAG: hypothetical protein HWE07_09120 [Cytophagia bacterium]|nr:hypothetical protein [Cytophagia bacterium]